MLDVQHHRDPLVLVSLVEDPPLATKASAVNAGQGISEGLADATRGFEERPGDQLNSRDRHLWGQPFGEGSSGRRSGTQLVAAAHETSRPRTRVRTASTP